MLVNVLPLCALLIHLALVLVLKFLLCYVRVSYGRETVMLYYYAQCLNALVLFAYSLYVLHGSYASCIITSTVATGHWYLPWFFDWLTYVLIGGNSASGTVWLAGICQVTQWPKSFSRDCTTAVTGQVLMWHCVVSYLFVDTVSDNVDNAVLIHRVVSWLLLWTVCVLNAEIDCLRRVTVQVSYCSTVLYIVILLLRVACDYDYY